MSDIRETLEEAWRVRHGYPLISHPPEAKCPYCNRFRRFLDAEAWESAVFMLLGGKDWHHMEVYPPQGRWTGYTVHLITGRALGENPKGYADTLAEAMALALTQACLKARENSDG